MRVPLTILILALPLLAGGPCCSVTAIGRDGVGTAKVNDANVPFGFRLERLTLVRPLKAGQPIYANFKARQVSLDGKNVTGSILSVSCPPPAQCPVTASACKDAGPDYCPASVRVPEMCKSGYYGAHCAPCPGAPSNVCSSHGSCNQGIGGSGMCTCLNGYTGPACGTPPQ